MNTDRPFPGVGFWLTVIAVALLAYPASLGPSCWVSSRMGVGAPLVSTVYRPLLFAEEVLPRKAWGFIRWYSEVGAALFWEWTEGKEWEYRPYRVAIGPVIHLP